MEGIQMSPSFHLMLDYDQEKVFVSISFEQQLQTSSILHRFSFENIFRNLLSCQMESNGFKRGMSGCRKRWRKNTKTQRRKFMATNNLTYGEKCRSNAFVLGRRETYSTSTAVQKTWAIKNAFSRR